MIAPNARGRDGAMRVNTTARTCPVAAIPSWVLIAEWSPKLLQKHSDNN
jgi:hypothetical protein